MAKTKKNNVSNMRLDKASTQDNEISVNPNTINFGYMAED